ncbi:hypothetical protein L198_04479 [Cryptococcus wingfieldii CBS 7118]|uniref:MARVEL domain-containing protein n=1 Tax=Cryptococcus wingfieldii CBS 7118 TaxID=1295528 RepID=A0A1E3J4Q0_9TREE|nr:hypothetical protein L198_04479 [Cryptococcus wingfieldii CBS 7118]ODN95860.1 hypothetical protein L198_04479 [Cryptococcus wingfieldii CBS 7118]
MPSESLIRWSHRGLFALIAIASLISLVISAVLVGYYNKHGYPSHHTHAYRDRIRILLVASVWTMAWALILIIGFAAMGTSAVFGLITHLVPIAISFLLFLIGVSALTGLTDKISCSKSSETFSRCKYVKGLVVISWIDTIFIFAALIFLITLAVIARGRYGARRSTLYLD